MKLTLVAFVGLLASFAVCDEVVGDASDLLFLQAPPSQLVAAPVKPPPAEGSCDNARFRYCQQDFATRLNTNVANLKDVKMLRRVISSYYRKAELDKGIVFLCRQRQAFQQCLSVQYDACVDPWLNMRRGQSLDDAFETGQIYRQIEFDCDGGFIQVVTHWGCIKTITQSPSYNSTFNQCVDTYKKAVQQDPTSYCTAGQVLTACVSSIFQVSSCPGSSDLVWWMCERLRVVFQLDGFCPSMKCVVPPAAKSIREAPEHRRFESRAEAMANGLLVSQARRSFYELVGLKNRLRRRSKSS